MGFKLIVLLTERLQLPDKSDGFYVNVAYLSWLKGQPRGKRKKDIKRGVIGLTVGYFPAFFRCSMNNAYSPEVLSSQYEAGND